MIENKIRRNTYNLVLPAATMLFSKDLCRHLVEENPLSTSCIRSILDHQLLHFKVKTWSEAYLS